MILPDEARTATGRNRRRMPVAGSQYDENQEIEMMTEFISLKDAARFEGQSYQALKKRMQRGKYVTRILPRPCGGQSIVEISVTSLSAAAQERYRKEQSETALNGVTRGKTMVRDDRSGAVSPDAREGVCGEGGAGAPGAGLHGDSVGRSAEGLRRPGG